ncbi:MAG: peptidoglycan DD-metalloendopeptidase family protein, partial [Pseudomonadales bacterium]|nr:peptidoglycan DD-metalloendopeptidase family protein [Pseudomonadales bacterium]
GIRGFGNLIILQHEGELLSIYGNNKDIDVVEGDLVLKGQVIGSVGEMGPGGAGLYFEIRYQGEVEDPYLYFADSGAA